MITVSAMMAAMNLTEQQLGFNLVYIATAIGAGSLIGSWMNDSGFWIVGRLSGFTERETLRSWTPMLTIIAVVGLIETLLFSITLPLAG